MSINLKKIRSDLEDALEQLDGKDDWQGDPDVVADVCRLARRLETLAYRIRRHFPSNPALDGEINSEASREDE